MEDNKSFEELEKDFTAIRDENRKCANTAFRIGSALLSLLALSKKTLLQNKEFSEVVSFLKGIVAKAVSYFQGIVNRGDINNDGNINNNGDIHNTGNIHNTGDITNTGNIMTNNLTVTGKATFFELEIQKAKAAGGMSVNSAGTFHVDAVEETPDGFVCYQRAEKDGVKLLQTCEVSDQMMCSNGMNILEGGKGNHFYWRKVTKAPKEVVTHTIDGKEEKCLKLVLSKTDHSKNTVDIPQVGDDLVQIGNPDNKERQSVMMSCAYNSFDPELKPSYWAHYMGVNDYEISKHRYTWFAANGSNVTGNFKVQSADGGLESIEDYVKGLATEKGKDTVVWQVAFSIRHITDKQGETFRLKVVRIVGDKAEEVDHAAIIAAGADLLVFGDNMGTEVRVTPGKDYLTAEYSHSRYLMARVVRSGTDITLAQDTIYTDVEGGKDGKDAVSYKLIPMAENALAYFTKAKDRMVDLKLEYKIQKTVGEQVTFTTLGIEGMTLTLQPSVEEEFSYESYSVSHVLEKREMTYVEISDNSYTVTLKKGSDIVDQRIVPITFKPDVVFDIDTVNGEIRSDITNVQGDISSFKSTIKETSITVGNLKKEYSQLEVKSNEISLTVNNGTRPNLLWGSDLNLDGVDTTNKAAIQKHLGVGLNATKTDSTEWFEYLKGGGVAGADAMKAKVTAVNGAGNYFAGLYWQNAYGSKSNIKVKPNTKYTFSFWIRTEILQGSGYAVAEGFNMNGLHGGRKDRTFPWTIVPATNEWKRMSYTFTTGDTGYIAVGVGLSGASDFSGLIYLCRPKLEEGDKATPWCAYDGTVEALLASGLDIKNRKMIATTDNFLVQNNKGKRTFMVDENGHINAKLIDATEIFGLKIAQPFESYISNEELRNGKSLSWILENVNGDLGTMVGREELNGVTMNIFNNTGHAVSLGMPLAMTQRTYQVEIPNNVMLRAIAIYRKEWDGCMWYPICPWEDIGNNRIRIKAFG